MTSIGLRPATARDSEFCFRLHKAALGDAVAAVWGWDEGVQRDFHDRVFAPGRWQIITADGEDAGMLHVEHRPTETCLARIELHPDHQGRGIGTGLIRMLLREPNSATRPWSWTYSRSTSAPRRCIGDSACVRWPGTATAASRSGCPAGQKPPRIRSALTATTEGVRAGGRRPTMAVRRPVRPVGGVGDEGAVGHS
jgi:GNAT superfamily N-acetyltransferase